MVFEIGQIVETSFGKGWENYFGRYLVLKLNNYGDPYVQVLRPRPYSDEEVGYKRWMTAQELFPDLY
jgi:hypothetical protein